jgi:hypothetical protein
LFSKGVFPWRLPHEIQERLERRWLARRLQEMEIRQQMNVLNETEVTDKKVEDHPAAKHSRRKLDG